LVKEEFFKGFSMVAKWLGLSSLGLRCGNL
jgi:hypothetical protein